MTRIDVLALESDESDRAVTSDEADDDEDLERNAREGGERQRRREERRVRREERRKENERALRAGFLTSTRESLCTSFGCYLFWAIVFNINGICFIIYYLVKLHS